MPDKKLVLNNKKKNIENKCERNMWHKKPYFMYSLGKPSRIALI